MRYYGLLIKVIKCTALRGWSFYREFGLTDFEILMSQPLTDEERHNLEERLFELKQEHRDLDDVINRILLTPEVEELQLKRFKKRKLMLKDTILKIENRLMPDILA